MGHQKMCSGPYHIFRDFQLKMHSDTSFIDGSIYVFYEQAIPRNIKYSLNLDFYRCKAISYACDTLKHLYCLKFPYKNH